MATTAQVARAPGWRRFLEPYRRITSTGQFIPEIDGLRFVAIFSVYIYHLAGDVIRHSAPGYHQLQAGSWLFAVTQILNIGVPLFFVISGFILGTPFAAAHLDGKRPVSLKKYFLRRITRLEPPYILSLLLFFAIKIVAARGTATELLPNFIASLFYVHNLTFGGPSVINIVVWSLEVEVQFYILAPVLAKIFAISNASTRRSALTAVMLLATGVSMLVSGNGHLQNTLLGHAEYFLAGFLLADLYLSGGDRRQANWRWDMVSLVGWSALLALLVQGGILTHWLTPWLILLLYIAAFHGVIVNRFVTNPWITTIGGMCYSLYLLHNYVVAALGTITERVFPQYAFAARLAVQFLLITPFVLVIGGIYFRGIERPCMRPNWPQELMAAFARMRSRRFPSPTTAVSPRRSFDK
jgi:peptidoglycan/LPS O-acetylase OafA/YrhL